MTQLDSKEIPLGAEYSDELERLRQKFGPYSLRAVTKQKEEWNKPIRAFNNLQGEPKDENLLHVAIYRWAGPSCPDKKDLLPIIVRYPEMTRKVQDFAQWILLERGFSHIKLYRGGLQLSNGEIIGPWSSVSQDEAVARETFTGEYPWSHGDVIGIEVPVKNIFTFYDGHPGFQAHPLEGEFILNERGIRDCHLISINGRQPLLGERQELLTLMPGLQ